MQNLLHRLSYVTLFLFVVLSVDCSKSYHKGTGAPIIEGQTNTGCIDVDYLETATKSATDRPLYGTLSLSYSEGCLILAHKGARCNCIIKNGAKFDTSTSLDDNVLTFSTKLHIAEEFALCDCIVELIQTRVSGLSEGKYELDYIYDGVKYDRISFVLAPGEVTDVTLSHNN